jgi:hypothetical protein
MKWRVMLPLLLAGVVLPSYVRAAVVVTEIMYNPTGANTGRQWIEVTNTGSDPVDLGAKTVRLFAGGGNHLIKAANGSSTILSPGDVAVIAENPMTFLEDWPSYNGTLLKSSFSLTASGDLGLVDTSGTTLSRASYTSVLGGKDDGNSLQRSSPNAAFVPGAPTPGVLPSTIPASLAAKVKPLSTKSGSTKQATKKSSASHTSKSSSHTAYDNGSNAPAATADAWAAGALPPFSIFARPFAIKYSPFLASLLSSIWFAGFLALLSFSGFSLIVIQRHYDDYLL